MAEVRQSDYAATLAAAKRAIQSARTRAVLAANAELIGLYWELERLILDRQSAEGWGTKVVERLSNDLRSEFPEMRGLSPRNLIYMRSFAAAWPDRPIAPQVAAQLPWGHIRELIDRLDDQTVRDWYARQAAEHGWSRNVLSNQIMSRLHERSGVAPSNFEHRLPAADSELLQQMTKDPYRLEFLTLASDAAERDLERAIVAQIERFLLELGSGFAFVGRQWRLTIADDNPARGEQVDEFYVDLLMFHIPTNRYVVIELKTRKLTPADVGQLNFYVAAIDGELALAHHAPTVGLLLCASRNERTVRYSLARTTSPMAIAGYQYTELPAAEQAALPDEAELVEAVDEAIARIDAIEA